MPSNSSKHSLPGNIKVRVTGWLRHLVLFPFLFAPFFDLHIARYYYGAVPALDVLEITGVYVIVTAVIYLFVSLLVKGKLERGLATLVLIVLFVCWTRILNPILKALHVGDNYNYYPLVLVAAVVLIAILCFAVRRLGAKAYNGLLYYLNTLFVVFVLVELGFIGFYAINGIDKQSLMVRDPAERQMDLNAKSGENIYLLLFDEYASSAELKEDWGYDNSGFDSFLKDRGFFINAKSRSNYCWTEFSMASLLHMDFFRRFQSAHNYCNYPDIQRSVAAIEHPRVVDVLKHAGYDFRAYSLFEVADQPEQYIPEIRINKGRLITVSSLYHAFEVNYLPYLKHRSQIKRDPSYRYPVFYKMDDYNNGGVDMVMREAREHGTVPKFVYAHFLMPHNTYYYDSSDHIMPMDRIKAIPFEQEPKYYCYNVQHTNKKIVQMVDAIKKHDPGATILVLGDHGYRLYLYEDDKHPEYFRNMSAIYFPDRNYASLPDSFTNVNVFRLVLNKVCGTHYPMLPDKSYTLSLKH